MRASVLWIAVAWGCAEQPSGTDASVPDDGPTPFANDNDADGYEPPFDCDDGDAQVYPGHGEFCNGVDDDCDGTIDEDAVDGNEGFVDADGDKVGDSSQPLVSCTVPGWSPVGGDCDDADPTRSPAFTESCNGIDDDCTGAIDDGGFLGSVHYPTIQDAILAAEEGDTVELCAGSTQMEGGIVVDRDLTITTDGVDSPNAVVDGSVAPTSVFVVDGGDLALDRVTVRGGIGLVTHLILADLADVRAGGAVNTLTGASGHLIARNSVFESNSAQAGGAIAAVTLEVTDCTFTGNVAEGVEDASGGAVWVGPSGEFTIERTTFDGNSAGLGGALQVWSPGLLVDVEGLNNAATVGGFLRAQSQTDPVPTVELVRVDIHDNVATVGAGVALIYASGAADVESLVHHNTSELCAGVHLVSNTLRDLVSWSGGTIQANQADQYAGHGGGLCIDADLGGAAHVADVVVLENEALLGGGVYVWMPDLFDSVDVLLRDLVITSNVAVDGAGFVADGDDGRPAVPNVILEDVEIAGNVASGSGGGLWVDDAWIGLTNGSVRDNAAMEGGGAFVAAAGALDATDTDFAGNVPDDVWLASYGATYDAADDGASFSCLGSDATCQ